MKILQLCKKFPFPSRDGESIAILNLGRSLHEQGAEVHLMAMNTSRHFYEGGSIPERLDFYKTVTTCSIDNRIKPLAAFLNLFSAKSYHIERFISPEFSRQLKELIQQIDFDIIQLETLYLAPYIPVIRANCKAGVCMRSHNVESEIWARITKNTSFGPKKWYLSHLTKKLARYEQQQLDNYDLLAAITQRDLIQFEKMNYKNQGVVVPIGIELTDYPLKPISRPQKLSIGFIGSLDWMPNLEGLQWFLDHIWADVQQQYPNLELHVAGRNTPDFLFKLEHPNLKIHGEVPSAKEFIQEHPILLVPLLSGSGMRVKILEGMALSRLVLTTKIGLEGIDASNQKEVLLAENKEEFLKQIQFCHENPEEVFKIQQNARELVRNRYDRKQQAKELLGSFMRLEGNELSKIDK